MLVRKRVAMEYSEVILLKKEKETRLKAEVLNCGWDKIYDHLRYKAFRGDSEDLLIFKAQEPDLFRVSKNVSSSMYHRCKKCRSKISSIVQGGCAWFGTLTFKDSVLASTTYQTRRRYVARLLKSVSTCYVGNIDYGDKTKNKESKEREHYHFVCYSDHQPDLSWWGDNCGFFKVTKVGCSEDDLKAVSKYTAKLSRHALKNSTNEGSSKPCPRLIYSRNTEHLPPLWLFE